MSATDRLPMLDEHGSRRRIIPAEVKGRLRTWRVRVHAVLMLILVALPWIHVNGMQAVLLDLPRRRFELFGVLFLSHDAPLLFFVMILAALALVTVTAIWGRVWCGWACPQTVFIDSVYRRIEIWIEGDYIRRRKLHDRPMDLDKFLRISAKWSAFALVSGMIAHSVMAYFAGSRELLTMMAGRPADNWGYFVAATSLTALLMFNFGWFREQFCVIMCPYGRFQSVLMDPGTITVLYDTKRGEPRKAGGDCVACNRCVQVCPVKIDIRDGIQMECISCTACIDACNEIMRKVKKPEGLIRHAAMEKKPLLRPRVAVYGAVMAVFGFLLVGALFNRRDHSMVVTRAIDIPYQVLQDGRVLNHFKIHYMNQSVQQQQVEFSLTPEDLARGISLTQQGNVYPVDPGGSVSAHVFVTFPASTAAFTLRVRDRITGKAEDMRTQAVGPQSAGS